MNATMSDRTQKLDDEKQMTEKQLKRKHRKQLDVEESKRQKVERSNSPLPVNPHSPAFVQLDKEPSENSKSYRHLFSFGNDGKVGLSSAADGKKANPGQMFSLLGVVANDSGIPASSRNAYSTARGGLNRAGHKSDQISTLENTDQLSVGVGRKSAPSDRQIDPQNLSSVPSRPNFHAKPPPRSNESLPRLAPTANAILPQPQSRILADEFDFSSDAVLAMARNFCRKTAIEDLETEWCRENGIRDQMRRDFKLKRKNTVRDRKLGSNSAKA